VRRSRTETLAAMEVGHIVKRTEVLRHESVQDFEKRNLLLDSLQYVLPAEANKCIGYVQGAPKNDPTCFHQNFV